MVTVFMKVMVKKIMRGSTSNQSVRSTFKNVCQEKHSNTETEKHRNTETQNPTFKEGIVMEESFGLDRNHIKTGGKASPQPTKDKRPGSAISVDGAHIIRS